MELKWEVQFYYSDLMWTTLFTVCSNAGNWIKFLGIFILGFKLVSIEKPNPSDETDLEV